MKEKVIKVDELENLTIETKLGNKLRWGDWYSSKLFMLTLTGFMIGGIMFAGISIFCPTNTISIANQMCNNYGGYMVSYKYNFINSNFASIICKVDHQLIELIH